MSKPKQTWVSVAIRRLRELTKAMKQRSTRHQQEGQVLPDLESAASYLPRLRDGENVLLVPPDDVTALAEAIARLADSPELRQRLGQGAKETSKAFGWDRIAEKTLEVYHAIRP